MKKTFENELLKVLGFPEQNIYDSGKLPHKFIFRVVYLYYSKQIKYILTHN